MLTRLIYCLLISLSICIIVTHSAKLHSWHLFNDTDEEIGDDYTYPYLVNIRQAWGFDTKKMNTSSKAYRELYFDRSFETIYKHQHPKDCKTAKFLISSGDVSGFSNELQVEGFGLALAMALGRVYMPPRTLTKKSKWKTPSGLCDPASTLDCYYAQWTHCTWDIIDELIRKQNNAVRIFSSKDDVQYAYFEKTGKISPDLIKKYEKEQVLDVYLHDARYTKIVPPHFLELVNSLPIQDIKQYYWWRALSVAYLSRPNALLSSMIKKYTNKAVNGLDGHCVSMYIRQGDREGDVMASHPFKEFAQVGSQLWDYTYIHDFRTRRGDRTIVLATESATIISEALSWGKKHNWNIVFNPYVINILESKGKQIPPELEEFRVAKLDPTDAGNLEYTLLLVNLFELMQCDTFVCTLASSYCRMLDQLRASIAAKPSSFFADLSPETCREPPCIGPRELKFLGW